MRAKPKVESTLADRCQTIISKTVRREPDPALVRFLAFLARDMVRRPARQKALDKTLAQRIRALVSDTQVDLDATLSDADQCDSPASGPLVAGGA